MYEILTGKQRSLVFPIMCNGHVKLDYSDNVPYTSDEIGYGIWAHSGSFTFESVITPYEINGYGTYSGLTVPSIISITNCSYNNGTTITHTTANDGIDIIVGMQVEGTGIPDGTFIKSITDATHFEITKTTTGGSQSSQTLTLTAIPSKKIMPGISQSEYTASKHEKFQSELYLPRASRLTHEMMIFYSTNFQVSLVNVTTHNENEPARYKIRVRLKLGTTTDTIDTDVVIQPSQIHSHKQISVNGVSSMAGEYDMYGLNADGKREYRPIGQIKGNSHNAGDDNFETMRLDNTTESSMDFHIGQKLWIQRSPYGADDYESIGTVTGISGSTVTVSSAITPTASGLLYTEAIKEATYINDAFHIACAYENTSKTINIFFNGTLIKQANHSATDSFSFSKDDYYLGANGSGATGANSATTNKQFMGELHELAIVGLYKTSFNSLFNLLPNYDKTLLYLRFEEVDI